MRNTSLCRLPCLTLAVLLLAAVFAPLTLAASLPEPSAEYYAADFAHVLSADTIKYIVERNGELEYACEGAQIVIVTVDYMDGWYADEYAVGLMNKWGVGGNLNGQVNGKSNGMLFVFATQEDRGWLTVGADIDHRFTDSMAEKFLDTYFWKYYYREEYDTGVKKLFDALIKWYESEYNVKLASSQETEPVTTGGSTRSSGSRISLGTVILIAIILWIIYRSIMKRVRQFRSYYSVMGSAAPRFRLRHLWSGPHIYWYQGPKGPAPGQTSPRDGPVVGYGGHTGVTPYSRPKPSYTTHSSSHSFGTTHSSFSSGHSTSHSSSHHSGGGHGGGGHSGGGGGGHR